MNYHEAGFRAFYHHFVVMPLRDDLKDLLEGFPGADKADCVLTYGYIDRERGLTLEVLASGKRTHNDFCFADTTDTIRSFIRIQNEG